MKILTRLIKSTRDDTSTQVLILANVASLVMAIVLQWDVFNLIFLYWLESVVIGFFVIVKMIHGIAVQKHVDNVLAKLIAICFFIGFFIVHFGGFMLGHFLFIYALFGDSSLFIPVLADDIPLIPVHINLTGVLLACILLFSSHLFSFWYNYIGEREYLKKTPLDYLFSPYPRVVVMHLTIILGGLLAMLLHIYFALILLSVLKIIADVKAHHSVHSL